MPLDPLRILAQRNGVDHQFVVEAAAGRIPGGIDRLGLQDHQEAAVESRIAHALQVDAYGDAQPVLPGRNGLLAERRRHMIRRNLEKCPVDLLPRSITTTHIHIDSFQRIIYIGFVPQLLVFDQREGDGEVLIAEFRHGEGDDILEGRLRLDPHPRHRIPGGQRAVKPRGTLAHRVESRSRSALELDRVGRTGRQRRRQPQHQHGQTAIP